MNVFSPDEASAILRKVQASLTSQGHLIVEVQTPEAVERMGWTGGVRRNGLFRGALIGFDSPRLGAPDKERLDARVWC